MGAHEVSLREANTRYGGEVWRVDRNDLRGMVPSLAELEKLIGYLGICNDRHVVILLMG